MRIPCFSIGTQSRAVNKTVEKYTAQYHPNIDREALYTERLTSPPCQRRFGRRFTTKIAADALLIPRRAGVRPFSGTPENKKALYPDGLKGVIV